MAAGWPRTGLVSGSSAPTLVAITDHSAGAESTTRAETRAKEREALCWRIELPAQLCLLQRRKHVLDDGLIIAFAFLDLAVDRKDPKHSALWSRVIEGRIAAHA